jgi:hypothetical protein
MIVCPNCGSDNVDAGLFPYNPGWELMKSRPYLTVMAVSVAAWLLAVAGIPAVGIPLFLVCWVAGVVLAIRNTVRYGWRHRVYRPTPCHCRHCANEWVEMPRT